MFCRSRLARACAVVACLLLGLSSIALPRSEARQGTADGEDSATAPGSSEYADTELIGALVQADLLDEWLDATSMSPEAALAAISDSSFEASRSEFLAEIERLVERQEQIERRDESIDDLERDVGVLEEVARDLRRNAAAGRGTADQEITTFEADYLRSRLTTVVAKRWWLGISFDPVALAEHRLGAARDDLMRELDIVRRRDTVSAKTSDATVGRLTLLHGDLQRVRTVLSDARQAIMPSRFEVAAARSAVVDSMAGLHSQRLLLTSAVGGLPLVTFDAYVRGAATLDEACPVEWNLLAGIGRVESFHGTIGGSTVQASGAVSTEILGPLLDGGATEREAAEAEAAAQAEAEAEAAAAEAAELAEAEEAVAAFNAAVWGEPVGSEPEAVDEPVGDPLYDPLLWGENVPREAVPEESDEGAEGEDDVPEFKGNGFAVIHDTDDGVLDGNSRWDRAVGPMQFIPETWSYWATDGNGDGATDPQNLYDAAASAGRFLCHLSSRRGPSPYDFVLGYNSSDVYVNKVMDAANGFGSVDLPVVPTD